MNALPMSGRHLRIMGLDNAELWMESNSPRSLEYPRKIALSSRCPACSAAYWPNSSNLIHGGTVAQSPEFGSGAVRLVPGAL